MDAVIGQCEILYGYIPPEKLRQAASLRWLACASSGVEQYLGEYLYAAPGVILTNSAGAYGITISEHIITTLLMLLRRIPEYYDVVHQHQWKDLGRIRSIYGSVITVVGTGDIGTAFAQRAKALGAAHIRGVHRTNKVLPAVSTRATLWRIWTSLWPERTLWCSAFPAPRRLSISLPGSGWAC